MVKDRGQYATRNFPPFSILTSELRVVVLTQKFPHDNIYDPSSLKLWEVMEIAFIRPRNITFDSYVLFSGEQKKGETIEQFYRYFKEFAEDSDFENREEAIIRDIFITNMLDDDIQRELLRDTVEPERTLCIAVNMEMGHQNQNKETRSTTTESV